MAGKKTPPAKAMMKKTTAPVKKAMMKKTTGRRAGAVEPGDATNFYTAEQLAEKLSGKKVK